MNRLDDLRRLRPLYDLAVIGAGPAGIAAARVAAEAGASVLLADLGTAPGGQIWRGVTQAPASRLAALGADYARGHAAIAALDALAIDYMPQTAVWSLAPGGSGGLPEDLQELGLRAHGATRLIRARRVVLATGALERPMPLDGWTLPQVMTAGAGQILLKSAGLLPSGKSVLIGSGPLLWLLAAQYLRLGHRPQMILDTTPPGRLSRQPGQALGFLATGYGRKGLGLLAAVRARVPLRSGVTGLRIARDETGLSVHWAEHGRAQHLRTDLALLHQGVIPNLSLARAAGCAIAWDAAQAAFRPVTGAAGQSSHPGLRIAGDGAGIAGAEAALASGEIAAAAALAEIGLLPEAPRPGAERRLARALRGRGFLDRVYTPPPEARRAQGAALACRCEEIRADTLDALLHEIPVSGPNQLKSHTRCGMGPCQGRMCGPGISETLAAQQGRPVEEIGYFRLRSPVTPVTLAELARLAEPEAAE
ncbi:(2Fe-2S)-binding protein [Salipiger sp. P9]|uniref:(2Fe-2S)-binding protein n=1 Tax=Salipiger pentaromativorans TaxID=2943193 RepID=UPI00215741F4|nr:(2Fe-2S)-binding protein [Salipiger pentaromativorans]MCR8547488.1 (2Fe-2S)-binding protein [Salipiger pentaromativorans]